MSKGDQVRDWIARGVMDDEHDTYPRICECCPAEFEGGYDEARAAGWACSPDGWLCAACMRTPTVH